MQHQHRRRRLQHHGGGVPIHYHEPDGGEHALCDQPSRDGGQPPRADRLRFPRPRGHLRAGLRASNDVEAEADADPCGGGGGEDRRAARGNQEAARGDRGDLLTERAPPGPARRRSCSNHALPHVSSSHTLSLDPSARRLRRSSIRSCSKRARCSSASRYRTRTSSMARS